MNIGAEPMLGAGPLELSVGEARRRPGHRLWQTRSEAGMFQPWPNQQEQGDREQEPAAAHRRAICLKSSPGPLIGTEGGSKVDGRGPRACGARLEGARLGTLGSRLSTLA